MLLAADVGNTNITWGLFDGQHLACHWRVRTDRQRTADEYAVLLDGLFRVSGQSLAAVTGLAVATVVPPLRAVFSELAARHLNCPVLFVGPDQTGGLRLDVDEPGQVGADRIANAVAAWERYRRAAIVVDFGTATNFDVISADGAFIGGAIAPGVLVSLEALFQRAAALPRIDLVRPPSPIGRNTVTNMQSGTVFGLAAMVDGMIHRIRAALGDPRAPAVATGGLAPLLAREAAAVDEVDPLLTLQGIRIIYERAAAGIC
ncbi:MAG: type III pantothenate kinase [Thermaerobacter sp.]|nr:pantothenate kinase [Bacillota bacterium]